MKLPPGWTKSPLGEVFPEIRVGFVGNVSSHYCDKVIGIPFYRTGNVREGSFSHDDIKFVTKDFHRKNRKSAISNGDILIARVGANLGMVCKVDGISTDANAANVIIIKKSDQADSDFFSEFLASPLGQSQIHSGSVGGAQGVFNTGLAEQIDVLVPPLLEQRAISKQLLIWNRTIALNLQLIAAKEERHLARITQLIARRSKLKRWPNVRIRDLADRIQRQGDGGKYPLLTIASASGFVRQEDKYSRYMAGESAKTYTLLQTGDFSYNKGNSKRYEFGCVFQLQNHEAALVPSVYVSFRLRGSAHAAYMRHLFAADYLKPQLRALVKTGVRNNGLLNISPDEFLSATVPLPPMDEQVKIANVLDITNEEIGLLRRQLAALKEQKRGLVQKLLTGEWRLPQRKP